MSVIFYNMTSCWCISNAILHAPLSLLFLMSVSSISILRVILFNRFFSFANILKLLQKTTINADKFIMWHLVLWQSEA